MPSKDEGKPNGGAPLTADDPDKEFWEKHGVTDPDEQEAIKARARVLAYDRYRTQKEADDAKNKKKKGGRPWYKED